MNRKDQILLPGFLAKIPQETKLSSHKNPTTQPKETTATVLRKKQFRHHSF